MNSSLALSIVYYLISYHIIMNKLRVYLSLSVITYYVNYHNNKYLLYFIYTTFFFY